MICFHPCCEGVCFRHRYERKLNGTRARLTSLACERAVLLLFCAFLGGCHAGQGQSKASIEFTRVPAASEGGPDRLDTIEGIVVGARSGQRIVLYARSGPWWVQPFAYQPFTVIRPDTKWTNSTHLGTEYAALLVDPEYRPPAKADPLPKEGAGVIAVASVKGTPGLLPEVSKTVHFSGYDWSVRTIASDRGGTITSYDPENVWTDESGALHLRVSHNSGKWTCAEVKLTRSLGYGSYRFTVRESSHLEPAAVLSMFTWDDMAAEENHRELDIEISRWGDLHKKNAQYVVQPYYVPENVARFSAPSGTLTHSIVWEPGKASFRTVQGNPKREGHVVSDHVFTSGVPKPGGETVHLNLYFFGNAAEPLHHPTEAVIEKFEFLP